MELSRVVKPPVITNQNVRPGGCGRSIITLGVIFLCPQFTIAESPPSAFAYVLQADSFAKSKAAAIERLATSGRDLSTKERGRPVRIDWDRGHLARIRFPNAAKPPN